MPKLYLAAPLFSEAELSFNLQLKRLLSKYFDVYLPQEDGGLMVDMISGGCATEMARQYVFNKDIAAIGESDFLLILLDGRSVDEGASFELGFAYALGKRCVAYQSDSRRLLPFGNNPMIDSAVECVFRSEIELISWAERVISQIDDDGAVGERATGRGD